MKRQTEPPSAAIISNQQRLLQIWIKAARIAATIFIDMLAGRPIASRNIDANLWSKIKATIKAPLRFPVLYCVDLLLVGVSLALATFIRLGLDATYTVGEPYAAVASALPVHLLICAVIFPATGLYSRNWRFASIVDALHVAKSVFLASLLFLAYAFFSTRLEAIPRSVIGMNAVLLVLLIAGTRLTFRIEDFRAYGAGLTRRSRSFDGLIPILLIGAGNAADLYLRALQRDPNSTYWPVGFLDPRAEQRGLLLRGVPILGGFDEFDAIVRDLEARNQRPRHVIFTDSPASIGAGSAEIVMKRAEQMGIAVSRIAPLAELRNPQSENRLEFRPIELTDLLERPQIIHDRARVDRLIRGTRILITGAGGSIGSELTRQVAALDPAELVLIDNSEYNLYAIDMELQEKFRDVPRVSYLCNIRESRRVDEICERHQPEIVFHAAALKHVPMVELNPCEGVLTNAIGTMNVAEAAKRVGARAMVQVSTDKVVNPTGVMGATKRLAELYCQALEIEGESDPDNSRFMTVRFGNVLGSSGSLIPLFKRQMDRGGPLTVTDPEMTRFFMTIREAVELTLQASAYGLEQDVGRGEIFVLDMGEPIKIIDIARRMIRLAGHVPDKDIKIEIVGLRPGEKLFEELFDESEKRVNCVVPGVLGAVPSPVPIQTLRSAFAQLRQRAEIGDAVGMFKVVQGILPAFRRAESGAPKDTAGQTSPIRPRREERI